MYPFQKTKDEKSLLKKAKKDFKKTLEAKFPQLFAQGYTKEQVWKMNLTVDSAA